MNERGAHPDAQFEHAENVSDQSSSAGRSFHQDSEVREVSEPHEIAAAYSRRARRAQASPVADADAMPAAFRPRDFRADTNEAAGHAHAHSAPVERPAPMRELPQWSPPSSDDDGQLSYFTQAVPMPHRQVPPPPLVNSVPTELAAAPRPMTRRQLRELEASQGTRPQADDAPALKSIPPLVSPEPIVFTDASGNVAPGRPSSAPVAAAAPVPIAAPVPTAAPAPIAVPVPTVAPVPVAAPVPRVAPAPVPPAPSAVAPTPEGIAARRGIDVAPEVYTPPVDQWAARPNEHQPGASFIRTVGTNTGILTTSALVIPSVPQAADITRPFSSTGEILVTGSIDLPLTLGTTGAHPARYDHPDIDALFAEEDHDFAPADSAPVRAIRAVSTHTSTHGVISAKKPASNRLPMMMAVTAGILAVGVAALFAAGMIFGYF